MPGRAEPAGYVEGEDAEVEGDQGEGDDGGGADAGVGDVDFWLGGGGCTVFVVGQADAERGSVWGGVSSGFGLLVVEEGDRLRRCGGRRGQKALDKGSGGGKR